MTLELTCHTCSQSMSSASLDTRVLCHRDADHWLSYHPSLVTSQTPARQLNSNRVQRDAWAQNTCLWQCQSATHIGVGVIKCREARSYLCLFIAPTLQWFLPSHNTVYIILPSSGLQQRNCNGRCWNFERVRDSSVGGCGQLFMMGTSRPWTALHGHWDQLRADHLVVKTWPPWHPDHRKLGGRERERDMVRF